MTRAVSKKRSGSRFLYCGADTAAVFAISERQIQRWAAQGMPRAVRGLYDVRACCAWYQARLKQRPGRVDNPTRTARVELFNAQREYCDLQNTQARAELLPAQLVARSLSAMVEIAAKGMEPLYTPALCARIAELNEPAQIEACFAEHCRDVRREIAAALEREADMPEPGPA